MTDPKHGEMLPDRFALAHATCVDVHTHVFVDAYAQMCVELYRGPMNYANYVLHMHVVV